jgi:hypothetical protein
VQRYLNTGTLPFEEFSKDWFFEGDGLWKIYDVEAPARRGQEVEFQEDTRRERVNRLVVVVSSIYVGLIIGIKHPGNIMGDTLIILALPSFPSI